jgi:hypothetical protein
VLLVGSPCFVLMRRDGRTGPNGWVRFVEGVGPAPCNPIELRLPDDGISRDVGCHNGYEELQEVISVAPSNSTGEGLASSSC